MAHFRKYRTSKGHVRYRAEIRLKGAKPYSKTFMRMTDAKIWAKAQDEKSQQMSAGIEQNRQHTVAEAVDRYIEDCLPLLRRSSAKACLTWWKEQIGFRHMDTLKPSELISLRDKLTKSPKQCNNPYYKKLLPVLDKDGRPKFRAPKTIQTYMDCLSLLYNKAMVEWDWVTHNPCIRIKKLKVSNERVRFLSDHLHLWPGDEEPRHWDSLSDDEKQEAITRFPRAYELPRFIDVIKNQQYHPRFENNNPLWLYYLFVIQLGVGLRLSEATYMVWEENDVIDYPIVVVDMRREVLFLKNTKQDNTPRLKPICNEAMDVLKKLYEERRSDSPLVFPHEDGTKPFLFDKRIRKAIRDAKLQDFRWHDLRHTTASYLSMMGAGQKEIMEALHHRTLTASQRYQHLSCDHLRGLMNKLTNTVLEEKKAPSRFEDASDT